MNLEKRLSLCYTLRSVSIHSPRARSSGDRALASGARSRAFESHRARHFNVFPTNDLHKPIDKYSPR